LRQSRKRNDATFAAEIRRKCVAATMDLRDADTIDP
jgi:hypothetical protein